MAPLGITAIFRGTGLPSCSPETIYLSMLDTECESESSRLSVIHAISSWLSSAVAKAISPKTLAAAISKAINSSPC